MNKDYKKSRRKIITIIIVGIAVPVLLLGVAIAMMFYMAQPVKSPSPGDARQGVEPGPALGQLQAPHEAL